jgi:hypothetical protein
LYHLCQASKRFELSLEVPKRDIGVHFLIVKSLVEQKKVRDAENIAIHSSPEQQTRLNLVLAEYHFYLPGKSKLDLDRCLAYLHRALLLSQTYNLVRWKQETRIATGKYYFFKGDIDQGTRYFKTVIE